LKGILIYVEKGIGYIGRENSTNGNQEKHLHNYFTLYPSISYCQQFLANFWHKTSDNNSFEKEKLFIPNLFWGVLVKAS